MEEKKIDKKGVCACKDCPRKVPEACIGCLCGDPVVRSSILAEATEKGCLFAL